MNLPAWCPLLLVSLAACSMPVRMDEPSAWQDTFPILATDLGPTGRNPYLILEPGYQLVLEHGDVQLAITALDQTRRVAGIETRVVEERETRAGVPLEVSRNFLAISKSTGDVYYFGEEVDEYKDGVLVEHEGAWLAGDKGARHGLLMPGRPLIGQKHYQEVAPGEALDRAEVVSLTGMLTTPAGSFHDVLVVEETTPLEKDERERKYYAPHVGLLKDEDLVLMRYGFLASPSTPASPPSSSAPSARATQLDVTRISMPFSR